MTDRNLQELLKARRAMIQERGVLWRLVSRAEVETLLKTPEVPQFQHANMRHLDLSNLSFLNGQFTGSDLAYCNLIGADFTGASVEGAMFHGASGVFEATGAGSAHRQTLFFTVKNKRGGYNIYVNCGCQQGVTLAYFRYRVTTTYPPRSRRAAWGHAYHALADCAEYTLKFQIKKYLKDGTV